MTVVLDAGALIALERNDRGVWAILRRVAAPRHAAIVPSTVIAQVWRGSRRQALLAKALGHCQVAGFEAMAREVGLLCGRTRTSDICDAHVALVATSGCDLLVTGDEADLVPLIAACAGSAPAILTC